MDIVKWLQHACVNNDIEICLVNHKGLLALSGEQLAGLTAQQFIELDPYNGEDLFNELNQFRKYNKCKSAETNELTNECTDQYSSDKTSSNATGKLPKFTPSEESPTERPASPTTMLTRLIIESPGSGDSLHDSFLQADEKPLKICDQKFSRILNVDYICPVEIHDGIITKSTLTCDELISLTASEVCTYNLDATSHSNETFTELRASSDNVHFIPDVERLAEFSEHSETDFFGSLISPPSQLYAINFPPKCDETPNAPTADNGRTISLNEKRDKEIRDIARQLSEEEEPFNSFQNNDNYLTNTDKYKMNDTYNHNISFMNPDEYYVDLNTSESTSSSQKRLGSSKDIASGLFDLKTSNYQIPLTVNHIENVAIARPLSEPAIQGHEISDNNVLDQRSASQLSLSYETIHNLQPLTPITLDTDIFFKEGTPTLSELSSAHEFMYSVKINDLQSPTLLSPTSPWHSEDSSSSNAFSSSTSALLPATLPCASPELPPNSLPESVSNMEQIPISVRRKQRTTNKRKRGPKLWEFLLDLLDSSECNPSIIRWEDRNEGIFRLIEQDSIASMWGNRRAKDNLSYDYFARALRYHYKSRMLISVPERKLVYKFGPKVMEQISK